MKSADRPPKPGRGVLFRALLAAVLTISLSATAVASAVLLEVEDVVERVQPRGPHGLRGPGGRPRGGG